MTDAEVPALLAHCHEQIDAVNASIATAPPDRAGYLRARVDQIAAELRDLERDDALPRRNSEYLLLSYGGQTYSGTQSTRAGASTDGTVANHVIRHTLTTAYAASFTTGPLGHVGNYRVFARVFRPTTNTGAVSVAFEWGTGDFLKVTRNDAVTFAAGERQGDWCLVDLGKIQIPPATNGTQQWQGQPVAKSTVLSDVLDFDYISFVPYQEGSGEAAAVVPILQTPTVFAARDEFNQAAGNLNGVALPVGGTWSTVGADATDIAILAGTTHALQRSTTSDVSGKIAIAGSATFTNTLMQVDVGWDSNATPVLSAIARYVDASNHLRADLVTTTGARKLQIVTVVAGVATTLAMLPLKDTDVYQTAPANGQKWSIRLLVRAGGQVFVALFLGASTTGDVAAATPTAWSLSTSDPSLAAGGALASGKVGFKDINTSVTGGNRAFDNFWAAVPVPDAAVFASRQMQFRFDGPLRQDVNGSGPWPVSAPQGDNVRLLPAGRENRTNRIIIDTCRNDPKTMTDPTLSKIQLQVVYTPRYLSIAAL